MILFAKVYIQYKVICFIFFDKYFVFSSGEGGWANRFHLVSNLFKYRWKYNKIYQENILNQLWYYVSGYLFKTELYYDD